MNISFIGQGINPESETSVGGLLIDSFADRRFNQFICISAFASQNAALGLSRLFERSQDYITDKTLIIGIDQKGTSKEALEALLGIDAQVLIYHTSSIGIFHPKIYLFNGESYSRIVIGSNNLTSNGLFTNDEASVLTQFEKPNASGEEFQRSVLTYLEPLISLRDPNIKVLNTDLINLLVEQGIVPTEAQRRALYRKSEIGSSEPRNNNTNPFPRKRTKQADVIFRRERAGGTNEEIDVARPRNEAQIVEPFANQNLELGRLVWRKSNLPKSDILYAEAGTNPTGGLRLTQARFQIDGDTIDQTTYFRNDLWGEFQWREVSADPQVFVATIPFDISILGTYSGQFNLDVRHKPSGVAGQGNYTTSISWGAASNRIKENDLRGRTLSIYAPSNEEASYSIVIE